MQNRRSFLAALAASTAGILSSPFGRSAHALPLRDARKLNRIGIQLYSVRDLMKADFEGTLNRLAEIGYREVEFAGYFNRTPAEVRAILDKAKLKAPSAHLDFKPIKQDARPFIEAANVIGHDYLVVPWLPEELRRTEDDWRKLAGDLNRIAEKVRAGGHRFAYHNHDFEFKKLGDVVPFDLLLKHTDPALVEFELDLYWITHAGFDPIKYISAHPKRFTMFHVKDSAGPPKDEQVDVGSGKIDFAAILRADAKHRKAMKHVFVEHDQPQDPLAFATNSFNYLKKLSY